MVLGARKTRCRRTIRGRKFKASGEDFGFSIDVVLVRSSEFPACVLLRVDENEQKSGQRDLYSAVWAGVRGLGATSSPLQGYTKKTTRKGVSTEFDSALELHPKFRLQDMRLRCWLFLDATILALRCIWRVDTAFGGRRFQIRIASRQCEAEAVKSSVQLWSCQIEGPPKV